MNIAGMLLRSAARFPGRPAISQGTSVLLDYCGLARRSSGLARSLRETFGLKRGDRVGIVMPNAPQYLEVLFAIWQAGLIAVPMNARLHSREITYILQSSESKVCFVSSETEASVADAVNDVEALERVVATGAQDYEKLVGADALPMESVALGDPAWLFYTSGTTGRPKGATLSHRNLLQMAIAHYADIDQMGPLTTMVHVAPLSHGCGLWSIASVGRSANNVVLESGSYDAEEVCRLIAAWPSISMYHAPTMLKRLINTPSIGTSDTTNLRTLIYGGSHMYMADLQRSLEVLGPKLVQIYGQGESPNTISLLDKSEHARRDHSRYLERLGSAGVARSGVEIRIADSEDRPLPPGELGEVLVRGDIVMLGILETAGRERQDAARRLATYRRRWCPRRRRLSDPQRPLERHDHIGREQHLSPRDRGGAPAAPIDTRSLRARSTPCRMGRGSRGRGGAAPGSSDQRERSRHTLP